MNQSKPKNKNNLVLYSKEDGVLAEDRVPVARP